MRRLLVDEEVIDASAVITRLSVRPLRRLLPTRELVEVVSLPDESVLTQEVTIPNTLATVPGGLCSRTLPLAIMMTL